MFIRSNIRAGILLQVTAKGNTMKLEDKKVSDLSVKELEAYLEKRQEEEKYTKQASLENSFLEAQKEARKTLRAKVNEVEKLLQETERLSEDLGIPFEISPGRMRYTPNSYFKKFDEVDYDFIAGNSDTQPDSSWGWYSSSSRC